MAKPKRPVAYDLNKQERRTSQLVQIGLTLLVVVFAVAVVGFIIVKNKKPAPAPTGEVRAVRVEGDPAKLIKNGNQPKVVFTVAEDPICPICGKFEELYGDTVTKLVNSGAMVVDYYMLGFLDDPAAKRDYSSRASAAAYCMADQSTDVFVKFHSLLYKNQPSELGPTWPSDKDLIEEAKNVGANEDTVKCIQAKKYINFVKGLEPTLQAQGFWPGQPGTPTLKINGKPFEWITDDKKPVPPDALIKAITDVSGPVPGLNAPAAPPAAPAPPAGPGAPAPAAPPAAPAPSAKTGAVKP